MIIHLMSHIARYYENMVSPQKMNTNIGISCSNTELNKSVYDIVFYCVCLSQGYLREWNHNS